MSDFSATLLFKKLSFAPGNNRDRLFVFSERIVENKHKSSIGLWFKILIFENQVKFYLMENKEIITLIFTGIVAICTAIYSYLTYKLVKETKLSREFHLEAHIIAYLTNAETSPDIVSLVIKNIGNGIAKNLRFKIIRDINYSSINQLKEIGLFNKNLDFFPPDYQNKYILMSLEDQYDEKTNDYIEFDLIYDDAIKKDRHQNFKLYFKDIKGLVKLTPPETYIGMISYRLEKIEKILDKKLK